MTDICYTFVKNKAEKDGCEIAQFIVQALADQDHFKKEPLKKLIHAVLTDAVQILAYTASKDEVARQEIPRRLVNLITKISEIESSIK